MLSRIFLMLLFAALAVSPARAAADDPDLIFGLHANDRVDN